MKEAQDEHSIHVTATQRKERPWRIAAASLLGATTLCVGSLFGGTIAAQALTPLPCDIYGSAGTSCVAAYSSVRALYTGYNGPLYQVQRASDNATSSVSVLAAGGYANAAGQDSFCAGTSCRITVIFDQSPQHNDLTIEPAGVQGPANVGAIANAFPTTVAGHAVYGIFLPPQTGYRRSATSGIAVNGQPETMYEVAS